MPKERDFYADYGAEPPQEVSSSSSFVDTDREYPIERRCCITGDEVKHSFCRYPDPERGSMMVMSRDSMLRFSRGGMSLTAEFERVLKLRRKLESRSGSR